MVSGHRGKVVAPTVPMTFTKTRMKPLSYYQATSVSMPKKDDYMTIYYYRKGVMVGMKRQFDDDFKAPKNCVEEKVLDEVSYNAHLKHYYEEQDKLKNEFREDLIAEYGMSNHLKANKIFDKAWELGHSKGLEQVEYYFQDFVDLFQDDLIKEENETLFELMTN